jgi:superfamily II DNA or RNA helicase
MDRRILLPEIFDKIASFLDVKSQINLISAFPKTMLNKRSRVVRAYEGIEALLYYQRQSLFQIIDYRHHVAVYGTGCGKTFMACAAIKSMLYINPTKKILFVSPKSVHSYIKKTLRDMNVNPKSVDIISHFSLQSVRTAYDKFLIIDEVHILRNMEKSKRARAAIRLARVAWKVLLMTATPIVNRFEDINIILELCNIQQPVFRGENLELLETILPKLNVVYKEKPVDQNFPDVLIEHKYIHLRDGEVRNYERFLSRVQDEIDEELNWRVGRVGNIFMLYMNAMVRVGDSGIASLAPKIRFVCETINDYKQQVIFSSWIVAGIKQVTNELKKTGVTYEVITGATPVKERERIINNYNNKRFRVLIFSKAGGEGINLLETDRVVILEPGWNSVLEQQAMDRAVRYKSHSNLPKEEQRVIVHKLYVDHPSSIDNIMKQNYSDRKEQMLTRLLNVLSTECGI